MATRKVQTPGAKPADTTIETPVDEAPVVESAGETPEAPQDQSTNETSSLGAPVEDERLDQVLENQKRIEGKLDQLLKAGGIEAPKKKRWVQGKNGYEQKEV